MATPLRAAFSIWLMDPNRVPILPIDEYISLKYKITLNSVGTMQLELKKNFPLYLVQEDSYIEIWREVPGTAKQIDGETAWIIRDWNRYQDKRKIVQHVLEGQSGNEILDRRHVDYPAGSSQSQKTAVAGNFMKSIVRENFISATDTTRRITSTLNVAGDTGDGPSITKGFSYRRVLLVLRDIVQDCMDQGYPMYFDNIYNPGTGLFTFTTFPRVRGTNRGATSSSPIVLSTKRGNLTEPKWSYMSFVERNREIVGGGNTGANRVVVRVNNNSRIARSPIGLRENFVEKTDTINTGVLTSVGTTQLRRDKPRTLFTAKVRETEDLRYQRDYKLGDIVVVEDEEFSGDAVLDSVEIVRSRYVDDISITLRVDEAI